MTGNTILESTGAPVVINSMADLTGAVTRNQLVIRSGSAGNSVTQMVEYPVYKFNTNAHGTGSTIMSDTGTASTVEIASFDFETTNTIDLRAGGSIYFDTGVLWPPRRSRGQTLHRQNHRGMRPRAESVDFSNATPEELTALQLLRQLVGQDEFRHFLRYGFVMVRAPSGLRYQIHRGRHVVDVWNERERVDGICVYLSGRFPPTDGVITRMLMAERDELELWRRGNSRLRHSGKRTDVTATDLERLRWKQAA